MSFKINATPPLALPHNHHEKQTKLENFYKTTLVGKYFIHINGVNVAFPRRKYQCVMLILHGLTLKEVSARLNISTGTVRTYLNNFKTRLNSYSLHNALSLIGKKINKSEPSFL